MNMNPMLMNQMMMMNQLNPLQAMQLNQFNQMKMQQNQMINNPMNINQFNQFNKMNQINNINYMNQMNQMGRVPIPVPAQFVQPGIQIMPMNMYNPILMQQIFHQNMMQENEIQRLNENYEYHLKRQKEAEMYKVVKDKSNNNNK